MTQHADPTAGIREAFDHWLWNHETATHNAITGAARQELKTWLTDHADVLTKAIANEVTTRVLKSHATRQAVVHDVVPCPVCSVDSAYSRELDRYVHYDGSNNRACWLAASRGETS